MSAFSVLPRRTAGKGRLPAVDSSSCPCWTSVVPAKEPKGSFKLGSDFLFQRGWGIGEKLKRKTRGYSENLLVCVYRCHLLDEMGISLGLMFLCCVLSKFTDSHCGFRTSWFHHFTASIPNVCRFWKPHDNCAQEDLHAGNQKVNWWHLWSSISFSIWSSPE